MALFISFSYLQLHLEPFTTTVEMLQLTMESFVANSVLCHLSYKVF